MSGIPKGFVRLTSGKSGIPILFPASLIAVSFDRSLSKYVCITLCGDPSPDGNASKWYVVEPFVEVQAALCRALGEQP